MSATNELKIILDRIASGQYEEADIETLRRLLSSSNYQNSQIVRQLGKYNVNIGQGKDIHIGDRIYPQWNDEAIQALVQAIRQVRWQRVANLKENDFTSFEFQSTGISLIDKLAKNLNDISQKSVMRYGLKLAFSPDPNQEYFISGGNQVIKHWEKPKSTWEISKEIPVKGDFDLWFTSVAISPNGQRIAACKAYQVQIWRLGDNQPLHTLKKNPCSNFFDVAGWDAVTFSHDGKLLAASDNQDVKLWDVESGKKIAKLSGHSDKVTCVVFHPTNKKIIASCSYDKTIKIWNITEQRCLGTLSAHRDTIYTLAFSPDGEILASGSNDNTIKVWNLSAGGTPETLRQHSDAVTSLVFSPDGKTLLSGSNDGSIIEWQIIEKEAYFFSDRHDRGVTSIAISPDGKNIN